jgi:hypothetical protein
MRTVLVVITALFSILTLAVVVRAGPIGFFEQLLSTPAGWQTLVDVTIALSLVLAWMWSDAKRHGRLWWPWAVVTVVFGSIGPLLYLLRRPASTSPQVQRAASSG